MSLLHLDAQITSCRRCEDVLSRYGVVPRPIFHGAKDYPILLLGQAPGKTEYEKNAPFQGEAGKSIKALFFTCGLNNFDDVVYQTSVTKCFPGRLSKAATDRVPSVTEVANCRNFLISQLALVRPRLIVALGSLSWKALLSIKEEQVPGFCKLELNITEPNAVRVSDVVGSRFLIGDSQVLPMIHPSGAANGTRSKYGANDERSKALLRSSLIEIGVSVA